MTTVSTSPPDGSQLARWCSQERFRSYVQATSDQTAAVALYEWNIAISGAFHEVIGVVEILLRNAIHERLEDWHQRAGRSGAWFDHPAADLSSQAIADVAKARARLRMPETQGRIVAELPFGFWRFLLERRHQANLWPQIRRGFPRLAGDRMQLRNDVLALHGLRNRIAHHEPIHTVDLVARQAQILAVAGYIDPAARDWVQRLSRTATTLAVRPVI